MYIDAGCDFHILMPENFCDTVNIHAMAAQIGSMCVPQLVGCKARYVFMPLRHPVHFRLEPAAPGVRAHQPAIRARMDDLMARRKASQPLEWPSAGSTFKRPEGYFAGTLIDQTGLKGLTVGGAQVSEKHAGFVINTGNATCADVQELIRRVQEAVYRAHGVRLEPEVRFVGE